MALELETMLGSFGPRDYSVRLVRTVCNVVPFAPDVPDWYSLVEGLTAIDPDAKRPVLDRAIEGSRHPDRQRALWMVQAMDTADKGIGVFSGMRSAYAMAKAEGGAERLAALETDTQQAIDAVLKGLGIAFVVHKTFPGSLSEKIAAFRATEAGQAILFYYAAIEVGLPFADNALFGGGSLVGGLLDRFGDDQQQKLAAVAGEAEAAGAMSLLQELAAPVDTLVDMAREHLGGISTAAGGFLATALDTGDKAAGIAATGADLLPVYRFLGGRLVAEVCLREAIADERGDRDEAESRSAAAVPVKYTRSALDLPDAPARRRGCFGFGFGLWMIAAGLAALPSLWGQG